MQPMILHSIPFVHTMHIKTLGILMSQSGPVDLWHLEPLKALSRAAGAAHISQSGHNMAEDEVHALKGKVEQLDRGSHAI